MSFDTTYETLRVEVDDHVLTLWLNRPERINAFNRQMAEELVDCWQRVRFDDDIRVVILTGAGKGFCSGVDRERSITETPNVWNRDDPGRMLGPKSNRCWKPVICAVRGIAAGGAFYFINESDIVICSDDAQFFDPHVTYNMVSACEPVGALGRLPYAEIMRMVLLGLEDRIGAQRALTLGLASDVTTPDDLLPEARRLAGIIARCSPRAVQGSVRAIWTAHAATHAGALEHCIQYPTVGNDPAEVAEGVERLRSGQRPPYRVR